MIALKMAITGLIFILAGVLAFEVVNQSETGPNILAASTAAFLLIFGPTMLLYGVLLAIWGQP